MNMNHVHVAREPKDLAWARATGGALRAGQKWRLLAPILRGYAQILRAWLPWPALVQGVVAELRVPDSRLASAAQEAVLTQPEPLAAHGYRTWVFGGALSALDRAALDPELFYVGALLHDAGLATSVIGEDFTIRSAQLALDVCARSAVSSARSATLADGIVAHFLPGLRYAQDPLGFYIQAGALLDLAGVRLRELPREFVRAAYARHPQLGLRELIVRRLGEERRAVPDGRTALLHCAGMPLAVRYAPTRRE
jgi:hypothetical protein